MISGSDIEVRTDLRRAWLVVALLWFVALLNYLDRLIITTMRDPIRGELHLSDAQFGLLTSLFLWVYAAASPFGGFVADRVGRSGIIIAGLFFWSAATFITGTAHSLNQMLLARVFMGISEACYIPAALALINDYHRGPTRSLATGLHMSGLYAGAALGGIGGYVSEYFGWRFGFKVFGMIGAGYGVVLLLLLRDAQRVEDSTSAATESTDSDGSDFLSAVLALLGGVAFWILLAVNVLVGIVNWSIYGWMPTFLKEHFHLDAGKAGLSATAYIQVASFAGVLVIGALADRWSRTNRWARALSPALGFLAAGPCLILTASTGIFPAAVFGLVVFGIGRGGFDANHMPLLREIADERFSATGYGILNLVNTLVGGIMVYVGGRLLDAHVDLAHVFQFAGAALFVAGILLVLIRISAARTL